jgi:hypothetical protein
MTNETKIRAEPLATSRLGDHEAVGSSLTENHRETRSTTQGKMSVVVIKDVTALEEYLPAWRNLVDAALEPNAFYEPWMLIPAVRAFGADKNLQFVLILTPDPARPFGQPVLCGLFPLEIHSHYNGLAKKLPIKTLSLWRHVLCYFCTPLLRTEHSRECLDVFFDWLISGTHGCSLMEFGHIDGDGPFHELLVDYFFEHSNLTCVTECYTRALFRPAVDADQYMRAALPRIRWKEMRRQERRLAETGRLEYLVLEPGGDVGAWIEEFIQLEAISWKGRAGRALACNETWREFFVTAATEAFHRGQLMMLALHLNGRPIAHKCNFLARPGSFAFKIAFDEEYARFSPGVLLELENIRRLHAQTEIRWMDSCADADRFMINHLWPDRRTISTLVLGTGKRGGDFFVAAIPMLRWLNRTLLRRKFNRVEP